MDTDSLEIRARLHAALGDPTRLAIVDRLALGDVSPGELDLGLPTNLLSHHLKILQEVGLIDRHRSEADRRRTYLRLLPGVLDRLLPIPHRQVPRVVFVCTHNSARSQLAAALWAGKSSVPATSAGTKPASRVHSRAIAIADRHGLSINETSTAQLDDVVHSDDLVVAVCDSAHEQLGNRERLHWSVPDPVRVDTDDAFENAFADLSSRIDRLAPAVRELTP